MLPDLPILTNPSSNDYGHPSSPPPNGAIHKEGHKLKPPTQEAMTAMTAMTGVHMRTPAAGKPKNKNQKLDGGGAHL